MNRADNLTNQLLIELPRRFDCRCMRRNVFVGYGVDVVKRAVRLLEPGHPARELLKRARPVRAGVPGEPDIEGIMAPNGRLFGIEVKIGHDRQSKRQKTMERVWRRMGAIYVIARDMETALKELA